MALKSHDPFEKHLSNSQIVITSLIAGATAGALAKTTIAPLDRAKINFQISNKVYSTRKALKFLLQTYKQQGFFALWRGNSATMVRIIPHAAIQFTAHEQWKKILKVDNTKNNSPRELFLAGSLAGITSQSLTYPLDVARARMAVTHKKEYATLRKIFVKMFQEKGIAAFYKGYIPTIAGVVPYAGVSFFTYDTLKLLYRDYTEMDNADFNPFITLGFGAIAGMLGQGSSYPLDIVRRRMQTDTQGQYKTIWGTVKMIRREGIVGGFYKGLSMNWIKGPIAVGISYSSYDTIKTLLRQLTMKYNNQKVL